MPNFCIALPVFGTTLFWNTVYNGYLAMNIRKPRRHHEAGFSHCTATELTKVRCKFCCPPHVLGKEEWARLLLRELHCLEHWLPVLANIEPPALRRKAATDRLVAKARAHESWPLHHDISNPPPFRLTSRKPLWRESEPVSYTHLTLPTILRV